MITRSQIQFYRSLGEKKEREASACFSAEGDKMVREALALSGDSRYNVRQVFATREWLGQLGDLARYRGTDFMEVTRQELDRMSFQKTPNQVVAVIGRKPEPPLPDPSASLILGLDQVQDPGNVGTIIRIADWFGIGMVIGSPDSADFYSPKVVQATMGSIFRVRLYTGEPEAFIGTLPSGYPVYGTHLGGTNIYEERLSRNGLIMMGNESHGLRPGLVQQTTHRLRIPDFSIGSQPPESLNVSVAAAIVCSEFRRRASG